ncbi:PhaM family polyhydroxyalkanoate granule multifunctional regulatory protein [Aquabacterium sp.]|uniref:PhaM family polyhydroxyalkanoate granule multifunctional regulatory protein n=1 Tax=Aquabacterium sp. TaxID=1872578 RepID=UPI003D6C792E
MPTRPTSPDPSNTSGADASSAFSGLGAGLSFFQDWMKAAGSALPNLQAAQGMGGKSATPWSLPTLDPEELDKRIQDLKTVQFWLEQNSRLIGMTIQGLEVQRMTLTTLRGMNVSMDAVRESLKARAAPAEAPSQPAAEPPAPPPSAAAEEAPADAAVNPLRWWDTLTQQFSNLANQAVQVAQASAQGMEAAASAPASAEQPPAPPKAEARKASGATKVPVKTGRGPATRKTSAASLRRRSPDGGSAD